MYVLNPRAGSEVSYAVSPSDPPPVDSEYSVAFTVEQLQ
jgi:hypothetical protein